MHPPRSQFFAFLREFSALCVASRGERSSRWNSPPRGHPRPEPQFAESCSPSGPAPIDFAPRSPPLLLSCWRAPGKGTKREVRREVRRGARMPCVRARCARARCLWLAGGPWAASSSARSAHTLLTTQSAENSRRKAKSCKRGGYLYHLLHQAGNYVHQNIPYFVCEGATDGRDRAARASDADC